MTAKGDAVGENGEPVGVKGDAVCPKGEPVTGESGTFAAGNGDWLSSIYIDGLEYALGDENDVVWEERKFLLLGGIA